MEKLRYVSLGDLPDFQKFELIKSGGGEELAASRIPGMVLRRINNGAEEANLALVTILGRGNTWLEIVLGANTPVIDKGDR